MRRSPKYDPQREEVYRWEQDRKGTVIKNATPVRMLRGLAKRVCRDYGIPAPPIKFVYHEGLEWAGIACPDRGLALNRFWSGRNIRTLAHELAHWIMFQYQIPEAPHGRTWLGIYLYLTDVMFVEPLSASLPSARKAGLRYKHPRYVQPGALRVASA